MSEKIKNCFMTEQPDFYKDVKFEGNVIATIRALTLNDLAEIRRQCFSQPKMNEKGEFEFSIAPEKLKIVRMFLSLGGQKKTGQEGWNFDAELTMDNINLLKPEYFHAINLAIEKIEKNWKENKEAILGNLNGQLD